MAPLGLAFDVASQVAEAFPDDDAPAVTTVTATPGPTALAPIPAVSRGAVVLGRPAQSSAGAGANLKSLTKPSPPLVCALLIYR